jgi:hypothetical protein
MVERDSRKGARRREGVCIHLWLSKWLSNGYPLSGSLDSQDGRGGQV